jgi:tRNA pseudouridine38-40 synthase
MQRVFFHMSYLGTRYRGWQRQTNTELSIQAAIEDALQRIFRVHIPIMGCGRTDAGVHARQYFFHCDLEMPDFDVVERLNYILPDDLTIFEILPMTHAHAHARYHALSRTYEYYLHDIHDAYLSERSYRYPISRCDFDLMRQAMQTLIGTQDMGHLCVSPLRNKHNICDVTEASLHVTEDRSRCMMRFTSNRFLKSQIRLIVARLIAVGEGVITVDDFARAARNTDLFTFKTIVHPQGLHLTCVRYPNLNIPPRPMLLGF